ncbi:MAG: C45 family autoproteolytic acyltransferase/hydrolase [Candidatus Moduliflexus flocculans]|nr:C45 family autoproteolytic acyltransferase/hydrolase [Candidatus Moduliflexus flocculans]
MKTIILRGSHHEMGLRQGALLKKDGFSLPAPDERMLPFARECMELMRLHCPELLDELEGIEESAGLDRDALLTLSITAPYDPDDLPHKACTVLAVLPERSWEGRTMVGRNFDFFHDVSAESATTYTTYPVNGYASLGNCDIWTGREDGINEAGLFIGQAAFFRRGLKPGVTFWFMIRMILDRCATVGEALKLLSVLPHSASWTYLLADGSGDAAVVEPTPSGVAVRRAQDGLHCSRIMRFARNPLAGRTGFRLIHTSVTSACNSFLAVRERLTGQ